MLVDITFYESPPEGGKKVRRLARTSLSTETLLGALDSIRGSIAKTTDPELVSRVSRVLIQVKENGGDQWAL